MNEPKKVSAVNHEAPECLESDYDENKPVPGGKYEF